MSKRDTWILRPGMPGVKVPGQTSLPPSEDEMGPPRGGTEGVAMPSPKKQRAADHQGSFDMEALKALLSQQFAEQAATLAETQRVAIHEAVGSLRTDFEQHREEQRKHQRLNDDRVKNLEDGMGGLARRLEALEKGGGPPRSGDSTAVGDRHLYTLVYGGWPRETQRKVILSDLEDVFRKLELSPLMDGKPFTTGARRSLALQSFCIRDNEHGNLTAMRGRMQAVVAALSNSNVFLGSDQNKLWVSFSKPKETRLNGNHAAWIRRSVRSTDRDQEKGLEADYQTGTVWLHSSKVASATTPPPEDRDPEGIIVDDSRVCRPWVDAVLIAKVMKVGVQDVKDALQAQKR